jgi:uncharacterized protein
LFAEERILMKLDGTHKFRATSWQVFHAILNPQVLQACIPRCNSLQALDATRLKASITTPLPGLKGPYGVVISMAQRQDPHLLVLEVSRKGRGGSVNAVGQISITDEADGALLSYRASAELAGPIAIANNPIGQVITRNSLKTFFEKLEGAIV